MSHKIGARWRATHLAGLALLALAALGGSARAASETAGETFPASVTPGGELAEGRVGQEVSISADGHLVAFLSAAPNLSPEATGKVQAYVKDLDSGALTLASRADGAAGEPADEPGGGFGVERPLLAAAGRYLAFESAADNLVADLPAAPSPLTHVYRRDLESGETQIVDRADGPTGEVLPTAARVLAISADGNLIAFSDLAEGLGEASGARPGEETIYVRDLEAGTTVEVAAEGAEEAAFSADSRYLLFTSPADLDPEANGEYEVYRRDLASAETLLVSRGNPTGAVPAGEPADGEAFEATFVGRSDCRVAFFADATSNLTATGEDPAAGIYLRDLCGDSPSTTLVSLDEAGEPFGEVSSPSTTDSGLVAFVGLVAGATFPEVQHFYLRDPVAGQTTVLDRASGADGEPASSAAEGGAMVAAGGCRAVFASEAGDLLDQERSLSGEAQAFVRQIAPCEATEPPAGEETPAVASGAGASTPAPAGPPRPPATRIRVAGLGRRALWLAFDGAGRARLRVQRLVTGRHHGWRKFRALTATATAPGPVELRLPRLPAGRYRLRVRLQGDPDNPTLSRRLSVGAS